MYFNIQFGMLLRALFWMHRITGVGMDLGDHPIQHAKASFPRAGYTGKRPGRF